MNLAFILLVNSKVKLARPCGDQSLSVVRYVVSPRHSGAILGVLSGIFYKTKVKERKLKKNPNPDNMEPF